MFLDEEHESHWPDVRFALMWHEYGGSGLGMSWNDVNDLGVEDIVWLYERMKKQRHDEAEAMKRGR